MVCLSIRPVACSPSAVSWIDAITALRYCFVIANYLQQNPCGQRGGERPVVVGQQVCGQSLELRQFIVADIGLLALGETVNKKRPITGTEQDDRSEAARFAAACPGNPLFNDPATQIGIHQAALCIVDRSAEVLVGNSRLFGKSCERLIFENSHNSSPGISSGIAGRNITLCTTKCQAIT